MVHKKSEYSELAHSECFIYGVSRSTILDLTRTYLNILRDAGGERAAAIPLFRSQDWVSPNGMK